MQKNKKNKTEDSVVTKFEFADFEHERFRWFAVLAQSGKEKKAKANLEERVKRLGMADYVGQILIPMRQEDRIDIHGKRKKVERRTMPGYLFVHMDPEYKAVFACVKDTPFISGFVDTQLNQDPKPVPVQEVYRMFDTSQETTKKESPVVEFAFEHGELVKVTEGPFTNFVGEIDEVKPDKMKLRLLISVFGRPTPVDIDFHHVEKIKQ